MYKKWIKSNKPYRNKSTKYKNSELENNSVIKAKVADVTSEDLNQQRDQSHNFSQTLNFVVGDWSTCSATCGSLGHRKRNVTCAHVTPNFVKIVSDAECQRVGLNKPETTDACSADKKKCAVWQTGPWSKCLPKCGNSGHSNRVLACVWEPTNKPAGSACDLKNKPAATKLCQPRTCPLECSDKSCYCSLSILLKLCRYQYFEELCCRTCQKLWKSKS